MDQHVGENPFSTNAIGLIAPLVAAFVPRAQAIKGFLKGALLVPSVLLCLFASSCQKAEPPSPGQASNASALSPAPSPPQVELESLQWRKDFEFGIAEGRVKNAASNPINDLIAVVSFVDKSGAVVAIAEAPVDSSVLAPGETSTFTALAKGLTDQVENASVEFKLVGGEPVPTIPRPADAAPSR